MTPSEQMFDLSMSSSKTSSGMSSLKWLLLSLRIRLNCWHSMIPSLLVSYLSNTGRHNWSKPCKDINIWNFVTNTINAINNHLLYPSEDWRTVRHPQPSRPVFCPFDHSVTTCCQQIPIWSKLMVTNVESSDCNDYEVNHCLLHNITHNNINTKSQHFMQT